MSNSDQQRGSTRTYRGNCHCGAVVYEAQIPEITCVNECNCSFCVKRGYLWVPRTSTSQIQFAKGSLGGLASYTFGNGMYHHKFCSKCATGVMATISAGVQEEMVLLNAHALQGLNTWLLERKSIDGASLEPRYQHPAHQGTMPTTPLDDARAYTGSCHCGSVTVALLSKPIDETYDGNISECNCSICERNAYLWIYPKSEHVVLAGLEKFIGRYSFGHRIEAKTFCRKCGIPLTNTVNPLSEEEVEALSEYGKKIHAMTGKEHAVNVRVLTEVDISKLKISRVDDEARPPLYVNP